MSGVVKSDLHFRIEHVLFIDIVGYSNLLITERTIMSSSSTGWYARAIVSAQQKRPASCFACQRAMEWRWSSGTVEAGYKMACKTQH